jgi:O-antigen/teichoic acid export membrane protein
MNPGMAITFTAGSRGGHTRTAGPAPAIILAPATHLRRLFLTGGGNIWYIEVVSASSRLGSSGLKIIHLEASVGPLMLDSSHSPPGPGETPPPRILQKFAYLLSARWVREALQTVFLIYLARVSSTTYGEFMLAIGLGGILVLVAEFGLNMPLVSLLGQKDGDPDAALTQVSLLKGALLLLALVGVLGFMEWQGYSLPLKHLMFMLSAGVGLEALSNSFFVALQVRGRQDLQGKIKALAAGLGFGYGLIALALGAPPLAVAAFKIIESLVNLGGSFILVRSQAHFRFKWPSLGRLGSTLKLGLVFALIEVSAILYNKANLFFLQKYAGADGVAQYSVTWQTVDGISGLVSNLLLQSILFPLFVQLWEVDRAKVSHLAQNTARWLLAAAMAVMFILFIESDRIITLVYGPKYPDAIWLQQLLAVTVVFAFMHNLAAFLMISMRLQRLLLIFYLGGLAFNLAWCSLVMPRYPLMGAALAMVLTKGGVALLTVSFCQRRLGLILGRPLLQLGLAVLVGALLYLMGHGRLLREVAEALALAPTLLLAGRWWLWRDSAPA